MIAHPPCTYLSVSGARWLYHPDDAHLPVSERREHPHHLGRRKAKEEALIADFKGDEQLKDFYEYVVNLSREEYQFNKEIVKKREVQYFRDIIQKTLKRRNNMLLNLEPRSSRNSTPYLIEEYIISPNYEAMIPDSNGEYSDEEIRDMIERINVFLRSNPIEGRRHLSLLVQKHRYQIGVENEAEKVSTGKVLINTDQQIAARLALSYLNKLNDEQLLNLAYSMQILTEEELAEFKKPYSKFSGKRTGQSGHETASIKGTKECYEVAEKG